MHGVHVCEITRCGDRNGGELRMVVPGIGLVGSYRVITDSVIGHLVLIDGIYPESHFIFKRTHHDGLTVHDTTHFDGTGNDIRRVTEFTDGVEGRLEVHVRIFIRISLAYMELMVLSFIGDEHQSEGVPHTVASGRRTSVAFGILDNLGDDIRRVLFQGVGVEGLDQPVIAFIAPFVYLTLRHTLVDDIRVVGLFLDVEVELQDGVAAVERTAVVSELPPFG